ncbi:prepilin-type N-terminal cleavage/methylation domain-containing protein [Luteolibacter algae]|uniref:Prepilin-type N-terminal cleavage/methylation domain-containing protein n=1 Tax=Luteolibacter algae TaxID=454151 RepID=A0ABW5D9C5_9BACT
MKNSKKSKGFTLVELLVVIVIVAVLASLGFMGASRALQASKAATCISNLKQVGTAVHVIREEGLSNNLTNPGTFPGYAGQLLNPWRKFVIHELIGEVQGYCVLEAPKYVWKVMPSDTILQNPLSERTLGGDARELADVDLASSADQTFGSYCYNAWIEGWISSTTPNPNLTRIDGTNAKSREIVNPALTILMGESDDDGSNGVFTGWANNAPQGNYKNGAHCVFVDNHVERIDNDYIKSAEGLRKHMQLTWR